MILKDEAIEARYKIGTQFIKWCHHLRLYSTIIKLKSEREKCTYY